MSERELADAGARLRALPIEERLTRLEAILAELARDGSEIRRRLEAELPPATGFAAANVRLGLALAFRSWSGGALRELLVGELAGGFDAERAPRATAVIAGGVIPMPTIEAIIAALLLGSTVSVRPARRDPVTAPAFRDAVRSLDPLLGACVSVEHFDRANRPALDAFLAVDAVVASGRDASIAALRERVPSTARLVAYGQRLSIAVVEGAPEPRELELLARDVMLWDQLGCLSPVAVFALSHAPDWAEGLAANLDAAHGLPRGEVPLAAAAEFRNALSEAELRCAGNPGIVLRQGRDWAVVLEADADWRPNPLHRFVRVHPVADEAGLEAAVAPIRGFLSTVGFNGGLAGLAARLAPRSARLGTLQTPPLHWNHDGIGTLRPLLGLPPLAGVRRGR